jgi:hypothetical protein
LEVVSHAKLKINKKRERERERERERDASSCDIEKQICKKTCQTL